MKLYLLQQKTFHQGNFGDLEYSGLVTIGVYTSKEVPNKILAEYIPIEFHAQCGNGLQELIITEIDSDVEINEISIDDNLYPDLNQDDYEQEVPEYNQQ